MTRILARHIIYDGRCRGLSIVEISDDATRLSITPFTHETAQTAWVDGTVEVIREDGKYMIRTQLPHR